MKIQAQSVIFDILVDVFGARPRGYTLMFGQIEQLLPSTPTSVLMRAVDLLVQTGELEVVGPSHDLYSRIYSRP